jgi:hypothetical protein
VTFSASTASSRVTSSRCAASRSWWVDSTYVVFHFVLTSTFVVVQFYLGQRSAYLAVPRSFLVWDNFLFITSGTT